MMVAPIRFINAFDANARHRLEQRQVMALMTTIQGLIVNASFIPGFILFAALSEGMVVLPKLDNGSILADALVRRLGKLMRGLGSACFRPPDTIPGLFRDILTSYRRAIRLFGPLRDKTADKSRLVKSPACAPILLYYDFCLYPALIHCLREARSRSTRVQSSFRSITHH
jgi:hypothetical protein